MDRPTARVLGGAILAVAALFLAVLTRRADAVVVATPFAFVAIFGLTSARVPRVSVSLSVIPRLLQGEVTTVFAELDVAEGRGRVRVMLSLPVGMEVVDGPGTAVELFLSPGSHRVEWRVRADRWGALGVVRARLTVTDLLGTRAAHLSAATDPVRVIPVEENLRRVVSPRALRTISGAHLSRQRGDGIEFTDVREFTPGDRARDVNWRVTARRGQLWVDERRPERSGEVVLFLDSFATLGEDPDDTLRRSAELAAALARRHVSINDRVGLVDLGGVLRWVRPGGGTSQLYRLVDTLVDTERYASSALKTVDVLPARALPRRCLVVALSPLLDSRGIEAIRTLRARGFDVAVIEVLPSSVPAASGTRARLARALWEVERESIRRDLRRRGIALAEWSGGEPIDPILDTLGVFRNAVLRAAR